MESLWTESVRQKSFKSLNGDIKTDVLIVGGGIAGILCADELKKSGVSCVLIEADKILGGVTGYTTAKITVQHGLIYNKIINRYGEEAARLYFKAQCEGLKAFEKNCKEIDCDFKMQDSVVYSVDNLKDIELEALSYDKIGLKYDFFKNVPLPLNTEGALKINRQAQFNPLKFCSALTKDITIYENTKALSLFDGGMLTDKGEIFAEKIIIATHFPVFNKYGGYFLKMYQHRSYVTALNNVKIPDAMYVDADIKGLSFREYNGALLLGGGSHRTGKKGGNWRELREFAKKHYPKSYEVAHWATQDCMTLDDIPYIGRYSKKTPGLYVATGFNKWGMTNAMVSAKLLTDMICGKKSEYENVFSPQRSILHPQLVINGAESVINLITPTAPRCPHLGCALKYNAAERTWDCPCHGSRFTENGKLIENPATSDKKL